MEKSTYVCGFGLRSIQHHQGTIGYRFRGWIFWCIFGEYGSGSGVENGRIPIGKADDVFGICQEVLRRMRGERDDMMKDEVERQTEEQSQRDGLHSRSR